MLLLCRCQGHCNLSTSPFQILTGDKCLSSKSIIGICHEYKSELNLSLIESENQMYSVQHDLWIGEVKDFSWLMQLWVPKTHTPMAALSLKIPSEIKTQPLK